MKLIDKDALVAEIEKRIKVLQNNPYENHKTICHLDSLKQYLDTLEVKEVDLQEEAKRKWNSFSLCYDESRGCDVLVLPFWVYKQVCKYFFNLGLKAQKGEEV